MALSLLWSSVAPATLSGSYISLAYGIRLISWPGTPSVRLQGPDVYLSVYLPLPQGMGTSNGEKSPFLFRLS